MTHLKKNLGSLFERMLSVHVVSSIKIESIPLRTQINYIYSMELQFRLISFNPQFHDWSLNIFSLFPRMLQSVRRHSTVVLTVTTNGMQKLHTVMYVVGSKSFRPDQLFKVTEIKQLCYFST